MASCYFKLRDECYKKVYFYECSNHAMAEVVSTHRYPLACIMHYPVYLFEDFYDNNFIHFHWVSLSLNFIKFFFLKKKSVFQL